MCTVCGCGEGHAHTHDHDHGHDHTHPPGHDHGPFHDHDHEHEHEAGALHYGKGPAGAHVPGLSQARMVKIEQDILGYNNRYADQNRAAFAAKGLLALNLVSSPGSGKTTLLCRTATDLKERHAIAVIEGDQQTSNDAERIRATGAKAIQVNTGKGCHLDAHMIGHAMESLELADEGVLFIENVGNLVCPAGFDLGEAAKVVILSVTEGEDKPLKYPDMFAAARLMILNKVDLLPHLSFDVEHCVAFARKVNPAIELIKLSATSGEGLEDWYSWIDARRQDALKSRVVALEAQLAAARKSLEG